MSAAARTANPRLKIVWGGAHATLDPASCLATGTVDACALGAGEEPMAAAVEDLRAGRHLRPRAGLALAREDGRPGSPRRAPATLWPRADYSLLDVERHFERRGARRLDYCSSRGARDGPAWMAIRAERVVAEAAQLAERYRLSEVLFQDEDFFADPARVDAIAQGLVDGGERLELAGGGPAGGRGGGGARAAAPPRGERLPPAPPGRGAGRAAARAPDGGRLAAARGPSRGALRLRRGGAPRSIRRDSLPRSRWPGRSARSTGASRPRSVACGRRRLVPAEGRSLEGWARDAEAPWPDARAERRLARAAFFFAEAQRDPGRRLGKHLVRLLALVRVRLGFFALDLDRLAVEASAILRTGRSRRAARVD